MEDTADTLRLMVTYHLGSLGSGPAGTRAHGAELGDTRGMQRRAPPRHTATKKPLTKQIDRYAPECSLACHRHPRLSADLLPRASTSPHGLTPAQACAGLTCAATSRREEPHAAAPTSLKFQVQGDTGAQGSHATRAREQRGRPGARAGRASAPGRIDRAAAGRTRPGPAACRVA